MLYIVSFNLPWFFCSSIQCMYFCVYRAIVGYLCVNLLFTVFCVAFSACLCPCCYTLFSFSFSFFLIRANTPELYPLIIKCQAYYVPLSLQDPSDTPESPLEPGNNTVSEEPLEDIVISLVSDKLTN